ncbi:MAG TPA: aspartate dehydrogenase [Chloroflexota bacterium]|nr:aspartate dehydrogenase [Chloroflexota bacterium]
MARADQAPALRIGIIGLGAIGRPLAEAIAAGDAGPITVSAVLVRDPARHAPPPGGALVTDDPAAFLAQPMSLVVEAGGHAAVREHGEAVLVSGRDLMIVSVGALADGALLARLRAAAEAAGRQILVPSGAIAGLDTISAAAVGGLSEVSITTRKPPAAWRGTAGEAQALAATEPVLLYEGPARAGVTLFPQNVNVAAALALAGVGLDATTMRVYADPTVTLNTHEVQARGVFGELRLVLQNVPSAENPKTGRIVAMSVLKAVRNRLAPLVVGV